MYNKDQEFRAWLVEERMLNPETMSKDQTKKEFARFVEDFNTGSSTISDRDAQLTSFDFCIL